MAEPTRGEADYIKLNPWKQKEEAIKAQKRAEEEARAKAEAERLAKEKEKRKWKPPKKTGNAEISPEKWKYGGFSSYIPPAKKKPVPKPAPKPKEEPKVEEQTEPDKPPPPAKKAPTYGSARISKKPDKAIQKLKKQESARFGSGSAVSSVTRPSRPRFQSKGTEDALAVITKSRLMRQSAATNTMRESKTEEKKEEPKKQKPKAKFGNIHNLLNKKLGLVAEEKEEEPRRPPPKKKNNPNFANMHAMLEGQFGGKPKAKAKEDSKKKEVGKVKKGVAAKLMAKLIGGKKLKILPPGDPGYAKYEKMRKNKLPEGAIRNCLERDGLDPEGFFNPKTPAPAATPASTPALASTPTPNPQPTQTPQVQQQPQMQQPQPQMQMQPMMQQQQMMMMPQQQPMYQQNMQMGYQQYPMQPNGMPPQNMQQSFAYNMPQQHPYQQMPQQPMQMNQMPYQQMQPQMSHQTPMIQQHQQPPMHQPQYPMNNQPPPQPQHMQQPPPNSNYQMQYQQPPPPPSSVASYGPSQAMMSSNRSIYSTQSLDHSRSRRHPQGRTMPRQGRSSPSYDEFSFYKSSSSLQRSTRKRNQNYSSTNPRYAGNTGKRRPKTPRQPRAPPPGSVVSSYDDARSETGTYIPKEPSMPPPGDFDDSRSSRKPRKMKEVRGTFMNDLDNNFGTSIKLPDKYGRSAKLSKDVVKEGSQNSRELSKTKKRNKNKPKKKKGKGIMATLTRKKKKKPDLESKRGDHPRSLIESFSEIDLTAIQEQRKALTSSRRRMEEESALDWVMEYSEEYGRPYYVNERTGERSWNAPPELV